jgi:hypothetical protein
VVHLFSPSVEPKGSGIIVEGGDPVVQRSQSDME